ncbi:hypothetical protein I6N89_06265 [Pelagibaca abyssi]|nr:hypothetical protein [Salipiger abyssi]
MRIAPVFLVTISLLVAASNVTAGAWPRAEGRVFISSAVRLFWPQDIDDWTSRKPSSQYYTFYAEYGLTERLTLGLDLGRSVSGDGKTVVFARLPLRARDTGLRIAAELGLGVIDKEPVLRPGLSLGLGLKNGWLSAEGLSEISRHTGAADHKLDLTWGWNLPQNRKFLLQMQTGLPHGKKPFARLASSIVLPVTPLVSAELGGTWDLTGSETFGVIMGVWSAF